MPRATVGCVRLSWFDILGLPLLLVNGYFMAHGHVWNAFAFGMLIMSYVARLVLYYIEEHP